MNISDLLAIIALSLVVLTLAFSIYSKVEMDKRIDKRVKEELAPYREVLDAMNSRTKRSPDEIAASMNTLPPSMIDVGKIHVVNLPREKP